VSRSPETFGDMLRQLRVEKDLTQEELAEQAGLSVRGISDLERGRNRYPYRATVLRLIAVLEPNEQQVEEMWTLAARKRGPSAASDSQPSVRLPGPLTAILGRGKEESQVLHTLRWEGARLVTLTGTGGVGKTRLALEVATVAREDYADGVTFVSLAPVTDASLVPSVAAATLGIDASGATPPAENLIAYLRDREHLLVLDNFEQVIDASVFVAELLSSCPRVKAVVTSRTALRVRGEHQIVIAPLALPDVRMAVGLEEIRMAPATALFLERARAANPALEITEDDAAAVAEICRRLDGLPLAIELAAAQVRHRSPQALLAQLDSRLDTLTQGSRDMPARQQTLRAALAWSYHLLSRSEQELFRGLSVFRGGADLEAVKAVCTAEGAVVLPGLEVLHDASLLLLDSMHAGATRIRILETIREYAREKLVEAGEEEALQRRHAAYFASLAEEAGDHLTGAGALTWLTRLREDLDNIRAALQWSLESGAIETGLRLMAPTWRFWMSTGRTLEGRSGLIELLEQEKRVDVPDDIRALALNALGSLMYGSDELERARGFFMKAYELRKGLRDLSGMATAANGIGTTFSAGGAYREAERWYKESLRLRSEIGDEIGACAPLANLANIARYHGEYERAMELYERALVLNRKMGHTEAELLVLRNIASLVGERGDYERAGQLFVEGLSLAREHDLTTRVAEFLETVAAHALEQGDLDEAEVRCQELIELARTIGEPSKEDYALINLADIALLRGDPRRATERATLALTRLQDLGVRRGQAFALRTLGEASRMQGEYDRAQALLDDCLTIRQELGDLLGIIDALEGRAALDSSRGRAEEAVRLYGTAGALRARLGTPLPPVWRARQSQDLGSLSMSLGENTFAFLWGEGEARAACYLPLETDAHVSRDGPRSEGGPVSS
jgi:predicted ATPase/DNA-binding XRE family transcriptional regulator